MNQTVLSLLKASHTLRSSHLEPPEQPMARNACFMAFWGHFWPQWRTWGQFQWVQMAPTDHPGCIPPRSNQYPLRSSHLEPPEPLMAINGRFMAFLGHFWPPWRPPGAILVGPNSPNRPSLMYPTQIQPSDQISSKNDPKWGKNDSKWPYMTPNGLNLAKNYPKCPKNRPKITFWYLGDLPGTKKWSKMEKKWPKMTLYGPKWSKMGQRWLKMAQKLHFFKLSANCSHGYWWDRGKIFLFPAYTNPNGFLKTWISKISDMNFLVRRST